MAEDDPLELALNSVTTIDRLGADWERKSIVVAVEQVRVLIELAKATREIARRADTIGEKLEGIRRGTPS